MIDRDHALLLTRQAEPLELSRGSLYYAPVPISQADHALMREIDRLHTEHPFAGARMLRDLLLPRGYRVGRRHVGQLMELMGIEALYRKKRGTKRNPAYPVYPYLLRTSSSINRITSGALTSPTSRCAKASCTCSRSSIGQRVTCSRGGFPTACRRTSASTHSRRRSLHSGDLQHRSRFAVHG